MERDISRRRRTGIVAAIFVSLLTVHPTPAKAWAHQGHILLTRMAALRVVNDPAAPRGLRDFLAANLKGDLSDCRRLAVELKVGADPSGYDTGLDKAVTLPDIVKLTPEGRRPIEPYGVGEGLMHYLDMEDFSGRRGYADDLSHKPPLSAFPHDVTDRRYRKAGFVPLRTEECYGRVVAAFGPGPAVADPEAALHWIGYLSHYVEDSRQPHHATGDARSFSYLAGRVEGVPLLATQPTPDGRLAAMHVPREIDPHGDLEYQLFQDTHPPRDELREEFWKDLQTDLDALAAERAKQPEITPAQFDPFRWDLEILSDSYDYLPLVGRAAQAGYATGKFDPSAFFTHRGEVKGQSLTIIQLIALQNAKAVLDTEQVWRLAWAAAHASAGAKKG